jgi:hypothetical protein
VPAERIKELNTKNRFNLTRTLPYRRKVVRQADGKWCVKRFIPVIAASFPSSFNINTQGLGRLIEAVV